MCGGKRLTSMVMPSSHLPLTHKLKLSMPMNQSGDGTILEMSDTYFWIEQSVNWALVSLAFDCKTRDDVNERRFIGPSVGAKIEKFNFAANELAD